MKLNYYKSLTALVLLSCSFSAYAQLARIIVAAKDNTLYSESSSISNGSGEFLFAGKTQAGNIRRALFQFSDNDLAFLVTNKNLEIDSVILTLKANKKVSSTPQTFTLHKLLKNWGEGTSNANSNEGTGASATTNDATWANSFFNTTTWTKPGADYAPTASATFTVNELKSYNIKSTMLTNEIKLWIEGLCCPPQTNFGWILIGNESANGTAHRFISSEHSSNEGPKLTIYYTDKGGSLGIDSDNVNIKPFAYYDATTSEIKIKNLQQVSDIELYDLMGNIVLTSKTNVMNAMSLQNGLYVIQAETINNVFKQKIRIY
jgi:hypothetical protein